MMESRRRNANNNNRQDKKVRREEKLTTEQHDVCRMKVTEVPLAGKHRDLQEELVYSCVVCGYKLLDSETKFDCGPGGPGFWAPATVQKLELLVDNACVMRRIQIQCNNCGAQLSHVFDDCLHIPGKRYCVNSAPLQLEGRKDVYQRHNHDL